MSSPWLCVCVCVCSLTLQVARLVWLLARASMRELAVLPPSHFSAQHKNTFQFASWSHCEGLHLSGLGRHDPLRQLGLNEAYLCF